MNAAPCSHLFLYGILQDGLGPDGGDWPFLKGLGQGFPATTTGALFAIPASDGWFPALIRAQGQITAIIHGAIHEASAVDIAAVDAFEGAEYTRMAIPVDGRQARGVAAAHAYVWTAPLPDSAEPIAHGNFAQWLEDTERKAWSGD